MRKRICIGCRTLYGEREKCPGGGSHETVSLFDADGRALLEDEVWGPDSRAREMRRLARAGAGGATLGGFADGCSASGCEVLEACSSAGDIGGAIVSLFGIVLAAIVVGILTMVLYWLVKTIVNAIRDALDKPKPHGALLPPPKIPARAAKARGVVRRAKTLDLPWREGRACAYLLELHEKRVFGGGAMLRDAEAAGFEIDLDDGRVVRVPPGRIRLFGKTTREDVDEKRLGAHLSEIESDTRKLFPHDFARTIVLAEGDRVEVLGPLETSADPVAGGGYRASAGVFAPAGVPMLRVSSREERRVRIADDAPPLEGGAEEEPAGVSSDRGSTRTGSE